MITTKRSRPIGLIYVFFTSTLAGCVVPGWAAPVPPSLPALLDKRDQSLNQLNTVWDIKSHADLAPQMRLSGRKQPMSQRIPGIIDNGAVWHITRNGTATLVTGKAENDPPSIHSPVSDQFYEGRLVMDVQRSADSWIIIPSGKTVSVKDPFWTQVWPSPGDSRMYPAPLHLNIEPEHFVALVGVSPLGMYGAHWSLVSETPQTWTLEGDIANDKFTDAERLLVTLSRAYDGAPLKISRRSLQTPAVNEWEITDYQQYKGAWIGHKIIHRLHAPGIVESVVTYTLQSAEASRPFMPPVPKGSNVSDYRLLGEHLTDDDVTQAQASPKHRIVRYSWSGRLPSIDDLKGIQQKVYPGEATPDPGQSGSASAGKGASAFATSFLSPNLPFAGGLLCLVGGVWMFKRRGVS